MKGRKRLRARSRRANSTEEAKGPLSHRGRDQHGHMLCSVRERGGTAAELHDTSIACRLWYRARRRYTPRVSGPRVDLADPCAEGALVFERLRREGYAVERVGIGRVPYSNADVVLLAGDLDDSLQILKRLRDDEVRGGVPVLLLGVPPNARGEGRGPAFGADAVFELSLIHI